jgi:hypothetical protein
MRCGAAFWCGVALAAGCARDLSVPNVAPLSVSPSTATVAPREQLQIVASGGAGAYVFTLRQKQSGDRAALSAAGLYQAGDDGPAADVVRVTDAAGSKVEVAIAVGPSLSLSPASALVAPGGRVAFSATGGKRPYTFSVADGPGAVDSAGAFVAAAAGDTVSHVQVRDATPDAAALVEVHVGPHVTILPGAATLAPFETLGFVAIGGQPPYRYSVQSADGATVDAATGHYQAGAGSGASAVRDTVTVTDALAQTAVATVDTGPPLTAQPPAEVHPFTPVRLTPAGGKPPYSFALARKGNRSRGTVDPVTGVYTPGQNFGAVDIVEVRDATPGGRALATVQMPPVGPLVLSSTLPIASLAADLNGDGRQDAVLLGGNAHGTTRIDTFLMVADGPPVLIKNFISNVQALAAGDLNNDGRDDLVVLDYTSMRAYLANTDGSLAPSILLAPLLSFQTSPLLVVSVPASGGGADHSIFYLDSFANPAACHGATAGLMRVDWPKASAAPGAPACAAAAGAAGIIGALAAGDFNHDGAFDLAFTDAAGLHVLFGPDFFGGPKTLFAPPAGFTFFTFEPLGHSPTNISLLAADFDGDGIDDLRALLVRAADNRIGLVAVKGASSGTLALGPFTDPIPSSADSLRGIVHYRPAPGLDRDLLGWVFSKIYRIAPDLTLRSTSPPEQAFFVNSVSVPDFNGDGVPDLLVAGSGANIALLTPGDGDGNFGRRTHALLGGFEVAADVDGDGAADVVYRSGPDAVQALLGGGHQLAVRPETHMPFTIEFFTVQPIFGSAPVDLLLMAATHQIMAAPSLGDGTWGPPQPLHDANGVSSWANYPGLVVGGDFGGAAPGTDLLGVDGYLATVTPLVREDPSNPLQFTALAAVTPPDPSCGLILAGPNQTLVTDVSGDGIADIVELCRISGVNALWVSLGSRAGGALSFRPWIKAVDVSPFTDRYRTFLGARLPSGRVPFLAVQYPSTNPVQLGSFAWNGAAFVVSTTVMPSGPTGLDVQVVSAGGPSVLVLSPDAIAEYQLAADGTFTLVRSVAVPGTSPLFLWSSPGAPADVLASRSSYFAPSKEAVIYVNAGDGTFP